MSGDPHSVDHLSTGRHPLDQQGAFFDLMAKVAEGIADTLDQSADVHERAVGRVRGAAERTARDRRLADAERAAATAYRNHEMPTEEVREAIRNARWDQVADLDTAIDEVE
jgi:hypothetical protein